MAAECWLHNVQEGVGTYVASACKSFYCLCSSLAWRRIIMFCIVRERDGAADRDEGYSVALLNGYSPGDADGTVLGTSETNIWI